MGGNVTVPVGQSVGGDFKNIPACQSNGQTGCVVAYPGFNATPPDNSFFGRAGSGIGANSGLGGTASTGLQVLHEPGISCRGAGALVPYFVTKPFPGARGTIPPASGVNVRTPWVSYPDLYDASCEANGGASWLQVSTISSPDDHRPVVEPGLGPRWGLHLVDINVALGNLVTMVSDEEGAYSS